MAEGSIDLAEPGKFVLTQKGGQALMHAGYVYLKIREGDNGKAFWRCSKHRIETCEARVTSIGNSIESIRGTHNHPPEGAPLPGQPFITAVAHRTRTPARKHVRLRKNTELRITTAASVHLGTEDSREEYSYSFAHEGELEQRADSLEENEVGYMATFLFFPKWPESW